MSDPGAVLDALDAAEAAFEYRRGEPNYEVGVASGGDDWETQLTKACRYLASCASLRERDGYYGAVTELCFGAIERSLEAYVLWQGAEDLDDFSDHEHAYTRAADVGLIERGTAARLQELYRSNSAEHYYGSLQPTEGKEEAMYELAAELHQHTVDQLQEGGLCVC